MLEELEYLELGWGAIATILLVFHLILAAGANLIVIAARNRYNMKPQARFRLRVPKIPKIKPRMQKIHFFRRKSKIDFGAQVGEDHEPAGNAAAETEIKPETITTSSWYWSFRFFVTFIPVNVYNYIKLMRSHVCVLQYFTRILFLSTFGLLK